MKPISTLTYCQMNGLHLVISFLDKSDRDRGFQCGMFQRKSQSVSEVTVTFLTPFFCQRYKVLKCQQIVFGWSRLEAVVLEFPILRF